MYRLDDMDRRILIGLWKSSENENQANPSEPHRESTLRCSDCSCSSSGRLPNDAMGKLMVGRLNCWPSSLPTLRECTRISFLGDGNPGMDVDSGMQPGVSARKTK